MKSSTPGFVHRIIVAGLTAALSQGCALLSKSEPFSPRYYSLDEASPSPTRSAPERAQDAASSSSPTASTAKVSLAPAAFTSSTTARPRFSELRLGRVDAGAGLRERIMYRPSQHERGYYEDQRWTEKPQIYLERALARELFEARGLREVVSGPALTLDLELVALEEVRKPTPHARIQIAFRLFDGRVARAQQTLEIIRAIENAKPEKGASDEEKETARSAAAVAALSAALREAVVQVADRVVAEVVVREREIAELDAADVQPR
jgi:ABC-type uncharacterized transport system auxiliary subunit